MTTHLIPPSIIGGHVAHKPTSRRYAYGATEWAIRKSAAEGKAGIDLDLTCNAEGVPYVNHWFKLIGRDSWFDPAGLLDDSADIRRLTTAECERIRWKAPDGSLWPMLTARQAMEICLEVGIVPCFEAKYDTGRDLFYSEAFWTKFKADADEVGIVPVIMTLPGAGKGIRKLKPAHGAGLVTMWLWRGGYPASHDRYIDLVKSRPRHPIYRVGSKPIGATTFAPPVTRAGVNDLKAAVAKALADLGPLTPAAEVLAAHVRAAAGA